jgi:hypothetical protein
MTYQQLGDVELEEEEADHGLARDRHLSFDERVC